MESRSSSCVGDMDGDGDVDLVDLAEFLGAYGKCVGDPFFNAAADFDDSGCVDLADLAAILGDYGNTCPVADLDIDSDNTNGTGLPDRLPGEDGIEDETDHTGKFVLVNNDDDDRNGTADKDQDGTITDEQDDLVPLVLEIRPDDPGTLFADFQLTYPANVRIWRFATRGDLATDVVVSGVTQEYDAAAGPVTLWVEGLSPSATMADTRIVADGDTDDDGIFDQSDAVRCTVFSLTGSPTSGSLGTEVTWTLDPAISPIAFDADTTANWTGFFEPLVGSPTDLEINYSAAQVREQSAAEAALLVGDGTPSSVPDGATFGTTGLVFGNISFDFGGVPARRAVTFSFELSADWHRVDFDTATGTVRSVADIPERMDFYAVETAFDETELPNAIWYFRVFVYLIDENADTVQDSPATITVDLVTTDASGAIVDRVDDVALTKVADDDDPDHITYHSDLNTPVVLVDRDIDTSPYPQLIILTAVDGGKAFGVPSQ